MSGALIFDAKHLNLGRLFGLLSLTESLSLNQIEDIVSLIEKTYPTLRKPIGGSTRTASFMRSFSPIGENSLDRVYLELLEAYGGVSTAKDSHKNMARRKLAEFLYEYQRLQGLSFNDYVKLRHPSLSRFLSE